MSLDELYETRLALDVRRQPGHRTLLMGFDSLLRADIGDSHPYSLSAFDRRRFGEVLRGAAPGAASHLFRLQSLNSLVNRPGMKRRPDRAVNPDQLFADAATEFLTRGTPVPLTWLAAGRLEGVRRIDFWTDQDLRKGDLVSNAYRLGWPRNYFPVDDPIVLLCPAKVFADDKHKLCVPTVLDGYEHGAFFATRDDAHPVCGHTLDLNDLANLRPGVNELISSDLPVTELEFVPMHWTPAPSFERTFQANSPLLKNLVDFFRAQA